MKIFYFFIDNAALESIGKYELSHNLITFDAPEAKARKKFNLLVEKGFAEADYIINFAVLKGHGAGITLCAKNHYGSLIRCPDGYLRDDVASELLVLIESHAPEGGRR